jgi:hypothetical protein
MPNTSKTHFTSRQRAEIFVRDRATCAFSGKSLWALDHGATPLWQADWVARVPVRGKSAEPLAGGVLVSDKFRTRAKDEGREPVVFFREGRATAEYLYFLGIVPEQLTRNLRRLARLHVSDWYFNRAVVNTMLAVEDRWLRKRGRSYRRDSQHFARAALRALAAWRKALASSEVPTFEARGMVPKAPSPDQQLLLELRAAESAAEISRIVTALLPYYRVNARCMELLAAAATAEQRQRLLDAVAEQSPPLSPLVLRVVESAVKAAGV